MANGSLAIVNAHRGGFESSGVVEHLNSQRYWTVPTRSLRRRALRKQGGQLLSVRRDSEVERRRIANVPARSVTILFMDIEASTLDEMTHAVVNSTSENPAVRRLQASLTDSDLERVITSYDRMHHRHNRH